MSEAKALIGDVELQKLVEEITTFHGKTRKNLINLIKYLSEGVRNWAARWTVTGTNGISTSLELVNRLACYREYR